MARKRTYLHEVDLMRVIFIFGVVLTHTTTTFQAAMNANSWSALLLQDTHLMLHFTRMGFMFMTGLVLFMNYYDQQNNWWTFWKKRYVSVGIPYFFWNALFVACAMILGLNLFSGSQYTQNLIEALIYGDHFYMYYILVTFQLYLIFPFLVALFKKFEGHHLGLMIWSVMSQIVLLIFIKYELPQVNTDGWWYLFKTYGDNVLVYQVYFVFGGFVALHYQKISHFVDVYAKPIGLLAGMLSLGTVGLFFFDTDVLHLSLKKAVEVHQPYMMIYALSMILFVFLLGRRYAQKRQNGLSKFSAHWIHQSAQVTFGIYLVQTIPLTIMAAVLEMTHLPSWGYLLLLPFGYLLIMAAAYLIAWGCSKCYSLSLLIGRRPKRKEVRLYDNTYQRTQKTTH